MSAESLFGKYGPDATPQWVEAVSGPPISDGGHRVAEAVEAVLSKFMEDEVGAHVVYVWQVRAALDHALDELERGHA